MYSVFRTNRFKKDYKKLSSENKELLKIVIVKLANKIKLDEKYKDHKLSGDFLGCRECHIKPDLLLIYKINNNILKLALTRVGSHSELFKN
ncbi:MAG: type II toxin-antitoxin system YafQ family toxin [Sulfurospirillum sp.]